MTPPANIANALGLVFALGIFAGCLITLVFWRIGTTCEHEGCIRRVVTKDVCDEHDSPRRRP